MKQGRTWTPVAMALVGLLAACGGSGDDDDDDDDVTDVDASTIPDAEPELPDAAPPDYCENLPALPTTSTFLSYVPPCEDFTFDTMGNLVCVSINDTNLVRIPYGGPQQLWVPDVSTFARGTRFLPGGDLLVANPDINVLHRVTPAGGVTTVISGLPDPNGLVIGRDGFAYLTHGGGQLRKINPDTGDYEMLVNTGTSYDGIGFSLDYNTLYFDEESGQVHAMDVGTGDITNYSFIAPTFLLDGFTVDECGNLYVIEMSGQIYRVTTDGTASLYYTVPGGGGGFIAPGGPGGVFIASVNFGSGIGGWRRDALYIMNLNGGMYEVPTNGIKGRLEPHLE